MTESAATPVVEELPTVTDKLDVLPRGKDNQVMVVEIDCRVMAAAIPGGHIAQQGVHRYRLFKHYLTTLEAGVISQRDKAELERCTEIGRAHV